MEVQCRKFRFFHWRVALALLPFLLQAAVAATAEPRLQARVAAPSAGMVSDDLIVYTADACEFGADRTGEKDSTEAIKSAIKACHEAQGGTVFLPAGRYRVEGTLELPDGVTLRGEWMRPDKGGAGKGTILMAYSGRGTEKPDDGAFITVRGATTLRDLSIWYPEQKADAPVPYPATIRGRGHSTVYNVTLYNSWTGFWNNNCSSMLVRRLYGTALKLGVHGAYAYDVPRIEHVSLSPKYWAESGLPGSPTGKMLSKLKAYLQKNLVGIMCGEQDWGYWWDIDIDWCQKGLLVTAVPSDDGKLLNTGNVAAGNVRIRNAAVGVFLENPGYPCFMLTGSDVSARVCPIYFGAKPDFTEAIARGVKPWYQSDTSLVVSDTVLRGGKYSVGSAKIGPYAISLKDCTFTGYANAAVKSAAGSVVVARCRFDEPKAAAYEMGEKVDQLVLSGNEYKGPSAVSGWESNDPRIIRDEKSKAVPAAIKYAFDHTPRGKPASPKIWDVTDFGAARGTFKELPKEDSTAAFQKALDAAGAAKGGTVYVPAGSYKLFGGVKVPPGVELRGSFEGAHYGNATMRGTMLWAIGGKDNPDDAPLVTLSRGSGVRGITVYYPHQGWSDLPEVEDRIRVKKYPPTVRAAAQSWIRDCTFIGSWTAIDAMTVKCDGIEIADVTGAALGTTLEIGHGTTGGTVRDLHFNFSGWGHQGGFPNHPGNKTEGERLCDFSSRITRGIVLGDVRKCDFFSCFNINVAEQLVLERDRYTGGSFRGKMWGVAFDAARDGVIGRAGSDAVIGLVASMGVFFRQGGGHYAVTEPGFRGRIVFDVADVWSPASKIADVRGGSVAFNQLISWCCYEASAEKGGDLSVFASAFVGDHMRLDNKLPCMRFGPGSKGAAAANVECRKILTIESDPSADVKIGINGIMKQATAER